MAVPPVQRFHRLQCRFPVAGDAEVIAVNVHGMRQAQFHARLRQFLDDLARRDTKSGDLIIEAMSVAQEFPEFDSAGIHQFHAIAFGRLQQPGDIVPHLFALARGDLLHDEFVVPHQHKEALVDHRGIHELFVRMARGHGRYGGIEGCRVAHRRIAIAGGKSRRDRFADAGAGHGRARHRIQAMVFRAHFAGGIHLGPGDMACISTPPGITTIPAASIVLPPADRSHDPSILDANIAHFPVDVVDRIIDFAVDDLQHAFNSFTRASKRLSTSSSDG